MWASPGRGVPGLVGARRRVAPDGRRRRTGPTGGLTGAPTDERDGRTRPPVRRPERDRAPRGLVRRDRPSAPSRPRPPACEPPLGDIACHEHDIRGAIGKPGARDAASVRWTADTTADDASATGPGARRRRGRRVSLRTDRRNRDQCCAQRGSRRFAGGQDAAAAPSWPRWTGRATPPRCSITCTCSAPPAPTSSSDGRFRTSVQNLTRVKFRRMDNIRGKTIAITGAARGIGYATATALLERGARVVIGDRDVALQESAVAQLTKLGPVVGLPARRHRPGVVRDVPRQGAHRRRRPHRRADQQRRRDADRPVPRAVRAGDPLVDRGQLLRRAHRLPVGAARDGRPPQRPHHQHRLAVRHASPCPARSSTSAPSSRVVGLSTALADEFAPHGVDVSVVMPTFTNTELIAGTTRPAAHQTGGARGHRGGRRQDARQAEDPCLGAAVRCGSSAQAAQMLGPRGRRWLNAQAGHRQGVPRLRHRPSGRPTRTARSSAGRRRGIVGRGVDADPAQKQTSRTPGAGSPIR